MKTREEYIKEAYEADKTLDPSSLARGWSLRDSHLRNQQVINFELTRIRKWRNRETGKILKVMPWYMPIAEDSRLNFEGLLKEVMPEFAKDVLADSHIYSGLMMQQGYMVENHNRVWFGLFISKDDAAKAFEDLGYWDSEKDEHDEMFQPDKEG